MKASAGKAALLTEIERLKREKPPNWQRDARATLRALQSLTREDDYRDVTINSDRKFHEALGRKMRPTNISPPI